MTMAIEWVEQTISYMLQCDDKPALEVKDFKNDNVFWYWHILWKEKPYTLCIVNDIDQSGPVPTMETNGHLGMIEMMQDVIDTIGADKDNPYSVLFGTVSV
jgi:hypothetical protein